ncbi:MAG: MBL fold metallo-hydrolase, partial [Verrucomicrobiaceae bacterium]
MATQTDQPEIATEGGFQRWRIGDVRVTKIVENETVFDIPTLFPKASAEAVQKLEWLKPHFVTDDWKGRMSIHALVVETPDLTIMVDTCIGNDRNRLAYEGSCNLQTGFLRDLEAAGFAREDVDVVLCTHLHFDHVGWNTMLVDGEWVPTFPNARYLLNKAEFDHWRDALETDPDEMFEKIQNLTFVDSVKPVLDAGLVDLVDEDHRVCEQIWFEPTPGHSPGHVCVRIRSGGQEGFITGDMIHHPAQFADAAWSMSSVDYDSDAA